MYGHCSPLRAGKLWLDCTLETAGNLLKRQWVRRRRGAVTAETPPSKSACAARGFPATGRHLRANRAAPGTSAPRWAPGARSCPPSAPQVPLGTGRGRPLLLSVRSAGTYLWDPTRLTEPAPGEREEAAASCLLPAARLLSGPWPLPRGTEPAAGEPPSADWQAARRSSRREAAAGAEGGAREGAALTSGSSVRGG